jgi:hypothetical protein
MNDKQPAEKIRSGLPLLLGLLCLGCLLVADQRAWARSLAEPGGTPPGTPQLNLISPRGVQRGMEHRLEFFGERLQQTEQVFLYDPASGISILEVTPIDDKKVEVLIRVADDCRLGEHLAQLRTRDGISEFRSFFVGALPVVEEAEPNNSFSEAQPIELDVTLSGVITNEDIDYFRFTGKKGERISVEVEAIRLGFLFDPAIALLDSDRFEIAVSDDTPLTKQDCWLSVVLPEDGDYYLAIREASFQGNPNCRYRMHVGRFGRPAMVFPAGGNPGESLKLTFIEQLAGLEGGIRLVEQEVRIPEGAGFREGIFYEDEFGNSPSPVPFRVSSLHNLFEPDGNQTFPEETLVDLKQYPQGVAINGIISESRQRDFFRFRASQNQVWIFSCYARRIGSALDPVMNIFGPEKNGIAGNDDSGGPDSLIRFQVPADGDYFVRIYDHLNRGGPDFVYRLEIAPAQPTLSVEIARNDRYSQNRQTIAVAKGNRFAVLLDAQRGEFGGELVLADNVYPEGVSVQSVPMVANLNRMPVVFEAAADAPLGGQLFDFSLKHHAEPSLVSGGFRNFADFVLGPPNNQVYYGSNVNRLAMAVIEPLPFRLEIVQPRVPLVRNGSINIPIKVYRDEGFNQAITLYFPFVSPGVGTRPNLTLPEGENEIVYPLNANANAQLGNWPMYVIGSANVNGPAWASTQLANLEIAEPHLKMDFTRVAMEQGQSTKIYCKVEIERAFEGEATAEIVGMPPGIEIQTPLQFTAETEELTFELKTGENSPIGKHSPFCMVTIMQNGEPITFRAGELQVQIAKPLPPQEIISDPFP